VCSSDLERGLHQLRSDTGWHNRKTQLEGCRPAGERSARGLDGIVGGIAASTGCQHCRGNKACYSSTDTGRGGELIWSEHGLCSKKWEGHANQHICVGNPAAMAHLRCRPEALRPCLSTGLPSVNFAEMRNWAGFYVGFLNQSSVM